MEHVLGKVLQHSKLPIRQSAHHPANTSPRLRQLSPPDAVVIVTHSQDRRAMNKDDSPLDSEHSMHSRVAVRKMPTSTLPSSHTKGDDDIKSERQWIVPKDTLCPRSAALVNGEGGDDPTAKAATCEGGSITVPRRVPAFPTTLHRSISGCSAGGSCAAALIAVDWQSHSAPMHVPTATEGHAQDDASCAVSNSDETDGGATACRVVQNTSSAGAASTVWRDDGRCHIPPLNATIAKRMSDDGVKTDQ